MISLFGHSKEIQRKKAPNTEDKNTNGAPVEATSKGSATLEQGDAVDDAMDDDENDKRYREKELKRASASIKPKVDVQAESKYVEEDETKVNTRLNALLYHTSEETIDLYKSENNSSDLLGRLYYDDYDSGSLTPQAVSGIGSRVSPAHTPLNISTPRGTGPGTLLPSNSYITSKLGYASACGSTTTSAGSAIQAPSTNQKPPLSRLHSFERGISFDTSTDDHHRSLTLKVKHPDFKFRRNNKTFLAGFNNERESYKAIEWLFEQMIIHGDTIIILQVLDEKRHTEIDKSLTNETLAKIELLNTHVKKVSLVYEVAIGKPQKLLKSAIDEYKPAMMIIGTHHAEDRNRSGSSHYKLFQKASFSKHFLECALVPVIVVKPTHQYIQHLEQSIDNENFFKNWIESIDISNTYTKEKSRRKNKLTSPLSSRSNSYLSLPGSVSDRAINNSSNEGSGVSPERAPRQEDRGRRSEVADDTKITFTLGMSGSRSRSRSQSRSQSRPKSTRLSSFFTHH